MAGTEWLTETLRGALLAAELIPEGLKSAALVAAIVLTAVWAVAVALVIASRMPPQVDAGPATMELGDEPPAVAGMLANRFRVPTEGVPATLLDLAARRVVRIEDYRPGLCMVRLTSAPASGLTDYECRVLDHLESKAVDGTVPAEALATGVDDESRRWWRKFRSEVVAEAQARGLSRNLWDTKLNGLFTVAGLVPAGLFGLGAGLKPLLFAIGGCFMVLGAITSMGLQRETAAGLAAAARWLGVREYLAANSEMAEAPAPAVAVWERYLAYAAALELARTAVRQLPMGEEDDQNAWSAWGGRWHPVKVRYPKFFPPAWGRHPLLALVMGVFWGGVGLGALYLAVQLRKVKSGAGMPEAAADAAGVGALVLLVPALVALAWGAAAFLMAVIDLAGRRQITGVIVRRRARLDFLSSRRDDQPRYYIAVEDGSSTELNAWRVRQELYEQVAQDEIVVADVTRYLGYVKDVRPATAVQMGQPADSAGA